VLGDAASAGASECRSCEYWGATHKWPRLQWEVPRLALAIRLGGINARRSGARRAPEVRTVQKVYGRQGRHVGRLWSRLATAAAFVWWKRHAEMHGRPPRYGSRGGKFAPGGRPAFLGLRANGA
jgi:hypothetical protein